MTHTFSKIPIALHTARRHSPSPNSVYCAAYPTKFRPRISLDHLLLTTKNCASCIRCQAADCTRGDSAISCRPSSSCTRRYYGQSGTASSCAPCCCDDLRAASRISCTGSKTARPPLSSSITSTSAFLNLMTSLCSFLQKKWMVA